MKKFLKDYFSFHKRDRNGIIVLLCIIFILIVLLTYIDFWLPPQKFNTTGFDELVEQIEKAQKDSSVVKKDFYSPQNFSRENKIAEVKTQQTLFNFNPNNLPEQQWKALGLSDKQIKIIKNYESKGGKFYKKEDVKKMYGISPSLYSSIEPYIQIPPKAPRDSFAKSFTKFMRDTVKKIPPPPITAKPILVELNNADTLQLKNLKGIGSTFAKRIIAYRERLGGFISYTQLLDVFGIDSLLLETLKPKLTLTPAMIRKIDINHCTVADLKKHPYFKYNIAVNIILYRDQHGPYSRVQDVKNAKLVTDEIFRKIAPYIALE